MLAYHHRQFVAGTSIQRILLVDKLAAICFRWDTGWWSKVRLQPLASILGNLFSFADDGSRLWFDQGRHSYRQELLTILPLPYAPSHSDLSASSVCHSDGSGQRCPCETYIVCRTWPASIRLALLWRRHAWAVEEHHKPDLSHELANQLRPWLSFHSVVSELDLLQYYIWLSQRRESRGKPWGRKLANFAHFHQRVSLSKPFFN